MKKVLTRALLKTPAPEFWRASASGPRRRLVRADSDDLSGLQAIAAELGGAFELFHAHAELAGDGVEVITPAHEITGGVAGVVGLRGEADFLACLDAGAVELVHVLEVGDRHVIAAGDRAKVLA